MSDEVAQRLSTLIAEAEEGREHATDELAELLRTKHRTDREHPDGSTLARWTTVHADEVPSDHDGIAALYDGREDGYCIRGVLSETEAQQFNQRLFDSALLHENMGGRLLGTSLLGLADRSPYYEEAQRTRRQIAELAGFDLEERIEAVLGDLGAGRPVCLPSEGPGQEYLSATVRVLDGRGGGYRAHTGNEFVQTYGSYSHLRTIAQLTDALSYFIVTQRPSAGGELVIYDLDWADTPEGLTDQFMTPVRDARLEPYPKAYVDPGPGDMIVFNGGRIWHKVADIEGATPRVTVGGFAARSLDERTTYYWN